MQEVFDKIVEFDQLLGRLVKKHKQQQDQQQSVAWGVSFDTICECAHSPKHSCRVPEGRSEDGRDGEKYLLEHGGAQEIARDDELRRTGEAHGRHPRAEWVDLDESSEEADEPLDTARCRRHSFSTERTERTFRFDPEDTRSTRRQEEPRAQRKGEVGEEGEEKEEEEGYESFVDEGIWSRAEDASLEEETQLMCQHVATPPRALCPSVPVEDVVKEREGDELPDLPKLPFVPRYGDVESNDNPPIGNVKTNMSFATESEHEGYGEDGSGDGEREREHQGNEE